jgi:hypothetical protein
MVVKIPKKMEMKSLLPAPCSPLPAHVLAFPLLATGDTDLTPAEAVLSPVDLNNSSM